MSAPTSASVRPTRSHSPIRACTRSIAAPARASSSISAGGLDHPQPVERPGWRAPAPNPAAPAAPRGRARPTCGHPPRPGPAPPRGVRSRRRRAGRTGRRSRPRPAPRGRDRRPGWPPPSGPPGGAPRGTARPAGARPGRSAAPSRARCSPRDSAGRSRASAPAGPSRRHPRAPARRAPGRSSRAHRSRKSRSPHAQSSHDGPPISAHVTRPLPSAVVKQPCCWTPPRSTSGPSTASRRA